MFRVKKRGGGHATKVRIRGGVNQQSSSAAITPAQFVAWADSLVAQGQVDSSGVPVPFHLTRSVKRGNVKNEVIEVIPFDGSNITITSKKWKKDEIVDTEEQSLPNPFPGGIDSARQILENNPGAGQLPMSMIQAMGPQATQQAVGMMQPNPQVFAQQGIQAGGVQKHKAVYNGGNPTATSPGCFCCFLRPKTV